jgi:hypothetical protein
MAFKQNSIVFNNRLEKKDFKVFANFMATNEFCFIQQFDFRVGVCLFYSIVMAHFHREQKTKEEMRAFSDDLRRWSVDSLRVVI